METTDDELRELIKLGAGYEQPPAQLRHVTLTLARTEPIHAAAAWMTDRDQQAWTLVAITGSRLIYATAANPKAGSWRNDGFHGPNIGGDVSADAWPLTAVESVQAVQTAAWLDSNTGVITSHHRSVLTLQNGKTIELDPNKVWSETNTDSERRFGALLDDLVGAAHGKNPA